MELNAGRLNARGGLELGTVYLIPPLHPGDEYPPSGEMIPGGTYPAIFGKKQSGVTPQSDRLKNACFYIISGHGGPDPGAVARVGKRELHEDEYAYDIALRLARNLMTEGATVYVIIRDPNDGIRDEMYLNNSSGETCMGKPIPRKQLDRLKQRVDKVNELYERHKGTFDYIRAVDIHVDSRSKGKRIDVFFYHSSDKYSKLLATNMRDLFSVKYNAHQPGRGFGGFVEQRNLYVLRRLKPPSILVETGNIQNEFDRRRILLSDNRQAMANWMAQAFFEDYKKSVR
jgi:N-acetylmuramoyl-L-alanine amidase